MSTPRFYNTMSHTLEEFTPGGARKDSIAEYPAVTIYSCGPTVYSYAHIGNFRTFVFNDLLRRYLKFRGFKVNHAMNITDVDDKTIAGSNREGISLKEYTTRYTEIFLDDLKSLNIDPVEHLPLATESIDAMQDIIARLQQKGLVYEKDGSLYFSISKFENYGRLSRLDRREITTGAGGDADEYDKDDARDFALWKAPKEGEPFWNISAGKGRPGWHIECSAMVRKIFNSTIDIHTGGVDLVFPHHENEIAQSEAAYDEPFVRYWLHWEHLLVEGAKMSKSLGNFYTLRDLTEKGFSPRAIRFLLLSAHYRKQLNFTLDGLRNAQQPLTRIDNFVARCEVQKEGDVRPAVKQRCTEFIDTFTAELDNDLNISGATGSLFEFIHDINTLADSEGLNRAEGTLIRETLQNADLVLGFIFWPESGADVDTARIDALVEERAQAKAARNFARADAIRDELLAEGIILEDSKEGTRWKKKN